MARARTSGGKTQIWTASGAVAAFESNPALTPVAISDSTANVGAWLDDLQVMAAAGRIRSISLTDTRTLTLEAPRFFADTLVIRYLPERQVLVVTGATAAEAGTIQADLRVRTFRVTDTVANVSARLDALNGDSKLIAVTLTDAGPVSMTHVQFLNDTAILGKLPAGATYAVAAVTALGAAGVQAHARVASFTVADTAGNIAGAEAKLATMAKITAIAVSDTAANVLAHLDGLDDLPRLTSIVLTDADTLSVTAARYLEQGAVLGRLAPGVSLSVTAIPAGQVAQIAADPRVATLAVADTLEQVRANLAALDALAEAGRLRAISVTEADATMVLSAEEQTLWQDAIALMEGTFTLRVEPAAGAAISVRPPVINLIWDESVDLAPAGFRQAIQTAASFFDGLITSPVTINIEVGWGEARDAALGAGLLGEAFVTTGVFRSFADYRADLGSHNTSPEIASALEHLADPGRQVFVPGAQAKALGVMAADGALTDGSIGFAADASLYTFDPDNRAVAGKVDLIGLAQHEITHALGRVSYGWGTTGFDLYRYSAPGVWAAPGGGSTYFSIDGGQTSLGTFSLTGDPADWGPAMGGDVQAAFLGKGIAFTYSEADVIALNALGFAMGPGSGFGADPADGIVIDPMAGGSAARMEFQPMTEDGAPMAEITAVPAPEDVGTMFALPGLAAMLSPPEPAAIDPAAIDPAAMDPLAMGGAWMPEAFAGSFPGAWMLSAEHP